MSTDRTWMDIALSQQGKPYIWGSGSGAGGRGRGDIDPATGQPRGYDCSGFVSWVLKEAVGLDLPAFTGTAYPATRALREGEQPRAGDVVFYNMGTPDPRRQHIALYMGNGKIVQSGGAGSGVNVDDVGKVGTPEYRRVVTKTPEQEQLLSGPQFAPYNAAGQSAGVGNTGNRGGGTPVDKQAWGVASAYVPQLMLAAAKHEVPVNVLAGLLIQESSGRVDAVSPAGAQGLMQFMPGTAQELGIDPFDPKQAIDAGAGYLKQLAQQSGGDWRQAVGKYNAGPNGNLNNTETRNHIVKVMGHASRIGDAIAGIGAKTAYAEGLPGEGTGDMSQSSTPTPRPPFNPQPVPTPAPGATRTPGPGNRQTGPSALSALLDYIARMVEQGTAEPTARPPAPGTPAATAAPRVPGSVGGVTGDADRGLGNAAPGTLPPGRPLRTRAPGPGGPGGRPQGWIDPNTMRSPVAQGIVGMANSYLEALQQAQAELATTPGENYERRTELQNTITEARNGLERLAPTLRQLDAEERERTRGTVVSGDAAHMKKIPYVREKPDGSFETVYIDNPEALEDPALTRQTRSDEAAMARQAALLASQLGISREEAAAALQRLKISEEGATTRLGISEAGDTERLGISEAGATARNEASNTTQRVTSALSAAVQQESARIAAQIRQGELTFQQGQERYKQWYQQNVEAPLAILDRQQRAAEYGLAQQRAVTERATGQAEHERGLANIGQQMFGTASTAYNQTLDRSVGAGWGQAQNAALRGEQANYPTLQVNESMDQFATRKVAEMLQGVSPYADNILAAGQQLGANAPPPTTQGMDGLMTSAVNTAQGALNNPFQMPEIPPFQMPAPVDVAGIAGMGAPNGAALTNQVQQYLPQPIP